MIKYNFIPSNENLCSCAIPVFFKLSENLNSSSLILSPMSCSNFYTLLNRETGLWGTNIDVISADHIVFRDLKTMGCNVLIKNKECFFLGPKVVFYDDKSYNTVGGIDFIDFLEMKSDLVEFGNLLVDNFELIERDPKFKIMSKALWDYEPAIEIGNKLISKYGIRPGSNVNLYGEYQEIEKEDMECVMIVVSPNNRFMNPCILKTFFEEKDKTDSKIIEFMAEISLLGKDYNNFYMFRKEAKPGIYLAGFFDLASFLVEYHIDTSVHLIGTRDH